MRCIGMPTRSSRSTRTRPTDCSKSGRAGSADAPVVRSRRVLWNSRVAGDDRHRAQSRCQGAQARTSRSARAAVPPSRVSRHEVASRTTPPLRRDERGTRRDRCRAHAAHARRHFELARSAGGGSSLARPSRVFTSGALPRSSLARATSCGSACFSTCWSPRIRGDASSTPGRARGPSHACSKTAATRS